MEAISECEVCNIKRVIRAAYMYGLYQNLNPFISNMYIHRNNEKLNLIKKLVEEINFLSDNETTTDEAFSIQSVHLFLWSKYRSQIAIDHDENYHRYFKWSNFFHIANKIFQI